MQRHVDDVVGGFGCHGLGRHCRPDQVVRSTGLVAPGNCVFGKLDHFQCARTVGQPADETAFLKRRDQAVNARLALEVEGFLHLLETRGNAGVFQALLDKADQFVLLGGQHGANSRIACSQSCERIRNK